MPDPEVWTVPASGGEPIIETYGFLTDIMRAYNGFEQRHRLRLIPLETFEFSFIAEDEAAQLAAAIIFGRHDEAIAVPLWQYGTRLSGAVGIGATLLPIPDAQVVPYRRSVDNGMHALVWKSPFDWELFNVSSTSASGVHTSDTATKSWAANEATVYPARRAFMQERVSVGWLNSRVMIGRVSFAVEQV